MRYSTTLMNALRAEKKSVSEMILLMDEMIISLQEYMEGEYEERDKKARENGSTGTGDENSSHGAKDGNTSTTSKTCGAAVDSQNSTATTAVPQPLSEGEGQGVTAAPGRGDK